MELVYLFSGFWKNLLFFITYFTMLNITEYSGVVVSMSVSYLRDLGLDYLSTGRLSVHRSIILIKIFRVLLSLQANAGT